MTFEDFSQASERAGNQAKDNLLAIFGEASPGTVFSEPQQVGDDLLFTAVAWERAGGFGFGGGGGEGEAQEGQGTGGGAGAGGGGTSEGRPVAVIRVGPSGIEVKPVIDFTKIGVTVLLGVFAIRRALR